MSVLIFLRHLPYFLCLYNLFLIAMYENFESFYVRLKKILILSFDDFIFYYLYKE